MNMSSDTVSKIRDCNRKKRIFFFGDFWPEINHYLSSRQSHVWIIAEQKCQPLSAQTILKCRDFPVCARVSVCVCVVFYDQIRIDQKWHCANLLVLNILAESSFSCSEALGGQGLMLPFETCRKHTNTHMSTKQKDRGRGEKEITMRFSASQSSPPTKLSESLGHADLSGLHQLASDWAIQIDWAWQEGTSRAELGQHDKDNAWSQMAALIIICLTPPQQNPFKAERH